jgi:hypothetical protein
MCRQRRQESPRISIDFAALRVVKNSKIVDNLIYRMGTVTHLKYLAGGLVHWDGCSPLRIKKQKALVGEGMRLDYGPPNKHDTPARWVRCYSFVVRPGSSITIITVRWLVSRCVIAPLFIFNHLFLFFLYGLPR